MNSTSFESRHAQYNVSNQPQLLNLTSSPKFSFKAPTAEDFDKGSRIFLEKPVPSPVLSMFASLWGKLRR